MSLAEFDREFKSKLGEDRRWPAFKTIAYYLLAKQAPVHIAETGCAREVDNWCGDGQSTRVWDWILERAGGAGVSFDINPKAVAYAQSKVSKMEVRCVDSVIGLRQFQHTELLDLLYLDSFDLTNGIESPTHHLAELTSVYPRLPSGCLIAVDDCVNQEHGKHRFVKAWLASLGVQPLQESYVTIWRKP
jgi:trans-aconitate methyltransferase